MSSNFGFNGRLSVAVSAAVLATLAGTNIAFAQASNSRTTAQPGNAAPTTPAAPAAPTSGVATATGGNATAQSNAPVGGAPVGNAPAFAPAPPMPGNDKAPVVNGAVPPSGTRTAPTGDVKIGDDMIVDLHVNDEDLGNVLEMLSIQSQRNIVATKNVAARVTANLYGVTFYEALEAILHVNGFRYKEEGNFIYVYTKEEFDANEQASRTRMAKKIPLNYLNAVDASEFVKPLLSDIGQIKANGKTPNFGSMGETPQGADDFANASILVVTDYEENIAAVEAMIKELDTKPASVLVEATILQAAVNENNAFGVDFAVLGSGNFAEFVQFGGPLTAVNALIAGNNGNTTNAFPTDGETGAVVSSPGNTAGAATLKVGVISNEIGAFVRMLDEVTDTTILSNPKILALNRMPSRVLVGRKVGYISTTSTDTATTQTVQFLDTGTQLYFRPFVMDNGMIRMELKPQVSEAQIRDVRVSSGQSITIPDEITNELSTNVIVPDGQTIVLGGLFRESTTSTRRQVPFLGDLPIVGLAFRGNEDVVERNEIIFMVTPKVVDDMVAAKQGAEGKRFVQRSLVGAREGLGFISRERKTGRLNIRAEELAAENDTDGALWKIRQSLWLNPHQPDMMALRERLTNTRSKVPSRSMLDQIIHSESGKFFEANAFPQETSSNQGKAQWQPWQNNTTNNSTDEVAIETSSSTQTDEAQNVQNQSTASTTGKNASTGMFGGLTGKLKTNKNGQQTFTDGQNQPMEPR